MKSEPKSWFALYTRPGAEKKVASLLSKRKIENYLPLQKAPRQWAERRRQNTAPLFKSLVFVKVTEAELNAMRMVDGVINILYWFANPAKIQKEEIETIGRILEEFDQVSLEKIAVKAGDSVRIINGSLAMWPANAEQPDSRAVRIVLPSLGYALIGEFALNSREARVFSIAAS